MVTDGTWCYLNDEITTTCCRLGAGRPGAALWPTVVGGGAARNFWDLRRAGLPKLDALLTAPASRHSRGRSMFWPAKPVKT